MKPLVGETYERENERRTVVRVTRGGAVWFSTAYLTHDHDGPDPSKLIWQPDDQPDRHARKREWGEWCAWAGKVVDQDTPNR